MDQYFLYLQYYLNNIVDIKSIDPSDLKHHIGDRNIFNFVYNNNLLDINIIFDYIYSLIDRCSSERSMIWFYEIDSGAKMTYNVYNYIIDNNLDYLYKRILDHEEVKDLFSFMIKHYLEDYIDRLEIFDIYKYVNNNILRTCNREYLNRYDYEFIRDVIKNYKKIKKYFNNEEKYIKNLLDFIEIKYENIDVEIYIFYRFLLCNIKYIDDKYKILKEYLEEYNLIIKLVNEYTSNKLPDDIVKMIIEYL